MEKKESLFEWARFGLTSASLPALALSLKAYYSLLDEMPPQGGEARKQLVSITFAINLQPTWFPRICPSHLR